MTVATSIEQTKKGLRRKGTKSGKTRRVYLPESALRVLRAYRSDYMEAQGKARMLFGKDYQERNLVFCRPDGDYHRPDRISSGFCELARKVGLKIGLHSLRHQHASEALSAGAPLPAVAARLGHASSAITGAIYAHVHQDDEHRIAEKWDSAFGSLIGGEIRRI
jgi:integrase